MNAPKGRDELIDIQVSLASLEDRLRRVEEYLGILVEDASQNTNNFEFPKSEPQTVTSDELEFNIGQNWFAKLGIVILTVGVAFTLSLPFTDLPPSVPSLIGYALATVMFIFSRVWRRSFEMMSRYFRWAGMALLYFSSLRLSYFGYESVLLPASFSNAALLVVVVGFNLWVGLRRRSPYLVSMALMFGMVTSLAVGTSWFVLIVLALLSGVLAYLRIFFNWDTVFLIHIPLLYLTYILWALNNPLVGNELYLLREPVSAPWFLPVYALILATGTFFRKDRGVEDAKSVAAAVFICGFSYLFFLFHTLRVPMTVFTVFHVVAAMIYIGLGIAFWLHEHSRGATFIYAMTGYAALSVAIIKAVSVPDVFVWLSLQSLLVVTTAIWFRSRFIVIANFAIFLAIVGCYVFMISRETGISLGFGLVALLTARILNWKKERMELETHFMRNAYLLSAFFIFPYALAHLVPETLVAISWGGIAVVYYSLNFIIRNRKYRWMGHGTLVLAVLYIIVMGIGRLEPVYRNISFLVLGSLLLVVSLIFSMVQARKRKTEAESKVD